MKKFFLLVISFALITSFSSAQTLEKFTARDAYEYVKQQGTLDNKEAISIIAIGMANEMVSMNVDFASGKADNWTIVTRSKDIQDTTMYFYTIMKVAGMMIATEKTEIETNAQETIAISTENWMNSDKVAILPLSTEFSDTNEYIGLEYLGLYPYISGSKHDFTNFGLLYVHDKATNDPYFFQRWLRSEIKIGITGQPLPYKKELK